MLGQLVQNVALAVALLLTGAGNVGRDAHHDDGDPSGDVDKGAVCVVLGPVEAVNAGARWRLDSSAVTHISGATMTGIPVGTHVVHYTAASGFVAPSDATVVVAEERTTRVSASYRAASTNGALRVTMAPAAAVTAGAKWLLDGSPTLRASGDTVTGLSVGAHTVRFTAVTGYTTPASQTVTVVGGQTAAATGTYAAVATTGSVKVTLAPAAAVTAGAKFKIDNGATLYASGATVASLAAGAHTVSFTAVTGYTTPANQTVTVVAGQTAAVTGTYTAASTTGSLLVTMAPGAAVTAGARWLLDSSTTQNASGVTLSGVAAGAHTVKFTAVTGYTTPANQTVTVVAGQTATVNASYAIIPTTGSVTVTLAPAAAVTAGAKWKIDNGATLYASGATVASLAAGSHTVSFTAVTGYTTPANQTVTVVAGQTASATGTYVAAPTTGSIKVTLSPAAAVTAGAQWKLDSGATLYASGATVANVAAGSHTVSFTAATGYAAPASQTVTVTAGSTTSVTATYTSLISFAATIGPAAAASCSCHGSTMSNRATLISTGRVVPGNANASPYVTKTSMQGYWGTLRQTVIDWINQGANP